MQVTFTTWTGAKLHGVLLALSGPMMRVAILGFDDIVELRFRGGQWFSDQGEFVEIKPYSALAEDDVGSQGTAGADPTGPGAFAFAWVN